MKNFIERVNLLVRRNPLLFIALLLTVIFVLFLILSGSRNTNENEGDRASANSDAFIVFKDSPFLPTGNVYSDQQIRKDVAFYARKQYQEYNPEKNPAVLFTVENFSKNESGIVTFSGKFEKHKGDVKVDIELLNNDRVKVSIFSEKDSVINDALPSASAENKYIASLPSNTTSYSISYSSEARSYNITVYNLSDSTLQLAKTELKQKLATDYSDDKVTVNYPSYLKGESSAASAKSNFDPNLIEDVGDGGEPVGN